MLASYLTLLNTSTKDSFTIWTTENVISKHPGLHTFLIVDVIGIMASA